MSSASQYELAIAWNNAAGLAALSPQPANPDGIVVEAVDGTGMFAIAQGYPYLDLEYNDALLHTGYNSLRTLGGLTDDTLSAEVTARVLKNDSTWANYNAILTHVPGRDGKRGFGFRRDTRFRLILLEAL